MLAYTWKLFLRTSARSFLRNGVFSHLQAGARNALVVFGLACSSSFLATTPLFAQTEVSSGYKISDDMKAKLLKKGDLTLRDTNFVEAMFAIRRVWSVNIVVGNELKGETVSCEFSDAPLHEILDTILSPRGYGYRPIGNSLVVVKLDAIRNSIPRFQSATIPVLYVDPAELERAITYHLSERGQLQIVPSAKSIVVNDYPEQIEIISSKVAELETRAKAALDKAEAAAKEAEKIALGTGNAAATGGQATVAEIPGASNKVAFFDLQFVKAENIAPAIQPLLNALGRISVVPKDNRLIVYDTEDKIAMLADAIRQLDVPRPQVRIAALIYDVSISDIRRMGVNWAKTGGKGNNTSSVGGVSAAQDSILFSAITAAAPAAAAPNGSLSFASLGSNFDLGVVINALATATDSRLLADPNVVIYDQEQAKIDSVREIPFQQLTQGSNGSNIGTTAFREAGITLTVTPQVSNDDTLTLIVNPKFSILAGLTPSTSQPIIDRREYTGTVRVRNRETIVIGGMRQREFNRTRAGIPYLMNIKGPLGELFKNKDATARESELIVFLTPEVIDTSYMGRDREHIIHANAVPALDSVMYPRIPERPCPLEDWKNRCGCKKKHGTFTADCPDCQQCQINYMNQEAGLPPGARSMPNQTSPVQVQESGSYQPEYAPQPTPAPQAAPIPASQLPAAKPALNFRREEYAPPPVEVGDLPLDPGTTPSAPQSPATPGVEYPALTPAKVRSANSTPPTAPNPFRANLTQASYAEAMPAANSAVPVNREPKRLPPDPAMKPEAHTTGGSRIGPQAIFTRLPPVTQTR